MGSDTPTTRKKEYGFDSATHTHTHNVPVIQWEYSPDDPHDIVALAGVATVRAMPIVRILPQMVVDDYGYCDYYHYCYCYY